jgi:hypothetical protein
LTSSFFAADWCGLSWTEWIPLDASSAEYRKIPIDSGLYRIRVKYQALLSYIGQTRMGLRPRLRMLMSATYNETMPYNDPHTAGPMHWLLRTQEGMDFECSAAPIDVSDQERQAIEDMLLWRYRIEKGISTLANYGRFHARYARPSNRKLGRSMRRLEDGQINPASGPSTTPLQLHGEPADSDWMQLSWSELIPLNQQGLARISPGQGLYKILEANTGILLYIGESKHVRGRLENHMNKAWAGQPAASYYILPDSRLSFQRHELEVDLIGAYYFKYRTPPRLQYLAS